MKEDSPSEILIKTLEEFGDSEAECLLVLFTNKEGVLVYKSNIESVSMRLGMVELYKAIITKQTLENGRIEDDG